MHQIFVTEFVSFVSFAEFVIKPAPVDHEWHEWHELYESHECPAHADVQSPYDLERILLDPPFIANAHQKITTTGICKSTDFSGYTI